MGSNREMIDAFVSGQLSEADHDLMAHHIATCEQCAAAVAAERAVRGELAKLLVQPDALPVPSPVVSSADLSVPPVPELQLDFVLDRTSEAAGLLLPREPVREVALDQLPPAPAHSQRRAERSSVAADEAVEREGQPLAGDIARVAYADDTEVATATAAGIADSVAQAAAALASSSPWETLEAVLADASPDQARAPDGQEMPAMAAEPTVIEASRGAISTTAEEIPLAEGEAMQRPDEHASMSIEDVGPIEETSRGPLEDMLVVEEATAAATAEEVESEAATVDSETATVALTVVPRAPDRRRRRTRLWGAAAAVLVIGLISVYATGRLRTAGGTGVATAAAGQLAPVSGADVAWRMTPSVLMPVLDSAVYNRVVDVTAAVDSLADSVDTSRVAGQTAAEETARPASPQRSRPVRRARRSRIAELLPQIVSDPPEADDPPPRPPPGETLPEVMRGNAPARVTTRGSAVVISGVPDLPRLLRTTTHRPRADVAYVLREYDASAAEPAPRSGVNEYRWSDATGSRLFVLSGPVDVGELRAYARQLQTR